jgi:hypothetical protein
MQSDREGRAGRPKGAEEPRESRGIRDAFEDRFTRDAAGATVAHAPSMAHPDPGELSEDGRAVLRALTATDPDGVEMALRALPPAARARLTAISPVEYFDDIAAPSIDFLHDRYDTVIPVGESRRACGWRCRVAPGPATPS